MNSAMRQDRRGVMSRLQDEFNRLFGNTGENGSCSATATWIPLVDIHEYADRFELYVDLPGVDRPGRGGGASGEKWARKRAAGCSLKTYQRKYEQNSGWWCALPPSGRAGRGPFARTSHGQPQVSSRSVTWPSPWPPPPLRPREARRRSPRHLVQNCCPARRQSRIRRTRRR
jgi:hypothetical protein